MTPWSCRKFWPNLFPGTVAQGLFLMFAREMSELSLGQNQRPAQIRVLGVRGRREWVASIFATVRANGVMS